jgi:ParB-like chromosome segregation protein Spo0J
MDADTGERRAAQLVENIHREALSLGDTADAVRDLYDEHGSVRLVADMLGKGAPWVSKMLALTNEATSRVVQAMLARDELADLDMAYSLARIERLAGTNEAKVIAEGIRTGQHNRASLRKHMQDLETETPAPDADPADHDAAPAPNTKTLTMTTAQRVYLRALVLRAIERLVPGTPSDHIAYSVRSLLD